MKLVILAGHCFRIDVIIYRNCELFMKSTIVTGHFFRIMSKFTDLAMKPYILANQCFKIIITCIYKFTDLSMKLCIVSESLQRA